MQKGLITSLLSIAIAMFWISSCKVCPAEGVPFDCEQLEIAVVDSNDAAVPVENLSALKFLIDSVQVPISDMHNGSLIVFANQARGKDCGKEPILTLQDSAGVTLAEMKVLLSNFNDTHWDRSERKNCGCYPEISAIASVLNVEVISIKCGDNKIKVIWD